jgi:hypothetical protein
MKSFFLAMAMVACVGVAHATEWPAGIADEAAVDAIISTRRQPVQRQGGNSRALPFTFDVPLDGEMFKDLDTMFLQVMDEPDAAASGSEGKEKGASTDSVVPGTPAHAIGEAFKNEPPIVCETVCRPMDEEESKTATKQAETIEKDAQKKAEETDAEMDLPMGKAVGTEDNNVDATGSFLQVSAKICEAKGGAFKNGECDEFMRSSEGKTVYAPKEIFGVCNKEFGKGYVPCSPYQALALAHLYKVADHSYYWLWPGGRHDQNTGAVMKQQIGNNPVAGLDQCPDKQHVGFFHNWDEAHVDSWGCLHDEQELPVLCCRQK